MARRALVTRPTIHKLETGDLSVSVAIFARVLEILNLDADMDKIAADDDLGQRLSDARTPLPHRKSVRSLADKL